MSDKIFIDTNIIIYLYSEDESIKRLKSLALIKKHNAIISTQIINEFSNILHKKFSLIYDEIYAAVKELENNFSIVIPTLDTIFSSYKIAAKYGFSYYDSLVIATAIEHGCGILYTEDMQHNQCINDTLRIYNPFL